MHYASATFQRRGLRDARIVRRSFAKPAQPPCQSKRVLLVEDDADLRALTAQILEREGYDVVSVWNGREAVRLIAARSANAFDLIISDIAMPDMGGEEMAATVSDSNPALKILFTSGDSDYGMAVDESMCRGFIPKPCTPSALVRKVREIIGGPAFCS